MSLLLVVMGLGFLVSFLVCSFCSFGTNVLASLSCSKYVLKAFRQKFEEKISNAKDLHDFINYKNYTNFKYCTTTHRK